MCGIAGFIGADKNVVTTSVALATSAISHRGPDDEGTVVRSFGHEWLGLGHRRLSILDLSPLGHQPMVHRETEAEIVFNGEIYNFQRLRADLERDGERFQSGSDTEVLLAGLVRHGKAFLRRLEGMYAFAFFDPREPSLLLARDPAGIKPLYFCQSPTGFVFASESRAILATKSIVPKIDRGGMTSFLAYGAVQHPLTLIQGISSLDPGSSILIRPAFTGQQRQVGPTEQFWRLPNAQIEIDEPTAIEDVRATMDAAVHDHLVADVPVGLFLSSGLDSTIIAGLAARHSPRMKSMTVVFADEPAINEQEIARDTAREFGLMHEEISISSEAAEAAMQAWQEKLDQPSIDGLNVFIISRAVREHGIKVALSGLGSDELFGGYPSFRDVPRLCRMMRLLKPVPRRFRRQLAGVAAAGRPVAVKLKLRDMVGRNGTVRSVYLQRRRAMSDSQLAALGLTPDDCGLDRDFLPPDTLRDLDDGEQDSTRSISALESRLYQGNMLLRDADANGMAFGLEIRVPFLDQRLLNLVHSIPGPVRLPPRSANKHLLRQAFADLLRPEILAQRKRGFVLPIWRWMAGPLRANCQSALKSLKDSQVLDACGIDSIWNSFLAESRSPMWTRALALVVLGNFVRRTAIAA
jgi:asparagine synthase (glutamine-hydrolysing)